MSFWESQPAQQSPSRLGSLLVDAAPLPAVLVEPEFLNALYTQRKDLVEYLARPETLRGLIDLAYEPESVPDCSFGERCQLAFVAAQALAALVPPMIESLMRSPELLERIFAVVGRDEAEAATSLGYFQTIVKGLFSELNPALDQFLLALARQKDALVLPLVERLSRPAAEVIKLILLCPRPQLAKLQNGLYEYLLFFYLNEKYAGQRHAAEHLDNLRGVFAELGERKALFAFKQKYVPNLFLPVLLRRKELAAHVLGLKLAVLTYVAETGQLQGCEKPLALLDNWETYARSERGSGLLLQSLRVLFLVAGLPNFVPEPQLLVRLFELQQRFTNRDVVLARLFAVLRALTPAAIRSPPALGMLEQNLLRLRSESRTPTQGTNPVPLGLVLPLLEELRVTGIEGPLSDWAGELRESHARLYSEELGCSEVNVSEVRLAVRPDFGLLGDNSSFEEQSQSLDARELLEHSEESPPDARGLLERSEESAPDARGLLEHSDEPSLDARRLLERSEESTPDARGLLERSEEPAPDSEQLGTLVSSDIPVLSPGELLGDSGVEASPAILR